MDGREEKTELVSDTIPLPEEVIKSRTLFKYSIWEDTDITAKE